MKFTCFTITFIVLTVWAHAERLDSEDMPKGNVLDDTLSDMSLEEPIGTTSMNVQVKVQVGESAELSSSGQPVAQTIQGSSAPDANSDALKTSARSLSLPSQVAKAGGIDTWNTMNKELSMAGAVLDVMCTASTVQQVLDQVAAIEEKDKLGIYAYLRMLYNKKPNLFYATLIGNPARLLPYVYTPVVGAACQNFGKMPFYRRGLYLSLDRKGQFKDAIEEYARAEGMVGPDGKYECDAIVFSDGGRILGLGDLGAWGMGIPIGKLDLYTVCGGVNPYRTIPVIIDAGIQDQMGNTDNLLIRDHPLYTGLKQDRAKDENGTVANPYFGKDNNMIEEFFQAAVDVFGKEVLLQFEDFASTDAFQLLEDYRERFLTYNDDIQGTAAVSLAGILGAIRIQKPEVTDLMSEAAKHKFLLVGAGAANLGCAELMVMGGVPREQIFLTNSGGLVTQKSRIKIKELEAYRYKGNDVPEEDKKDLVKLINILKPTALIGATGMTPGAFTKDVVEAMVASTDRPIIFALSNPLDKAEATAKDVIEFSQGKALYGSGTRMPPVEFGGKKIYPGQVNNVYVFPGMSMGAIACKPRTIPDELFVDAAEAVANSLETDDIESERVVPHNDKLRTVALNVATAVCKKAHKMSLTTKLSESNVKETIESMMWKP